MTQVDRIQQGDVLQKERRGDGRLPCAIMPF